MVQVPRLLPYRNRNLLQAKLFPSVTLPLTTVLYLLLKASLYNCFYFLKFVAPECNAQTRVSFFVYCWSWKMPTPALEMHWIKRQLAETSVASRAPHSPRSTKPFRCLMKKRGKKGGKKNPINSALNLLSDEVFWMCRVCFFFLLTVHLFFWA